VGKVFTLICCWIKGRWPRSCSNLWTNFWETQERWILGKELSTVELTPTMADLQYEPKMCQELVYQHQDLRICSFFSTNMWHNNDSHDSQADVKKKILKTSWNSRLIIQMHHKEEYIYAYFKEYKHSKNNNGA
jgi:hypothetical protein